MQKDEGMMSDHSFEFPITIAVAGSFLIDTTRKITAIHKFSALKQWENAKPPHSYRSSCKTW
jgi:hypothetical protein